MVPILFFPRWLPSHSSTICSPHFLHDTQNFYRMWKTTPPPGFDWNVHFFSPHLWLFFKRLESCIEPSVWYPNKTFSLLHEFVITRLISVSFFGCTTHNLQILWTFPSPSCHYTKLHMLDFPKSSCCALCSSPVYCWFLQTSCSKAPVFY